MTRTVVLPRNEAEFLFPTEFITGKENTVRFVRTFHAGDEMMIGQMTFEVEETHKDEMFFECISRTIEKQFTYWDYLEWSDVTVYNVTVLEVERYDRTAREKELPTPWELVSNCSMVIKDTNPQEIIWV